MKTPEIKKMARESYPATAEKGGDCCGPTSISANPGSCCSSPDTAPGKPDIPVKSAKVDAEWSQADHIGQIRCRLSNSYRMNCAVAPGLYALGASDKQSDVFVSANYKLSFDVLRRSLRGLNAWILVLDTKGINVWCAAGEGTFGTDELIKRISEADIQNLVAHKRIIVPQLGAPGVAAHIVRQKTGFRVYFGPVRAEDIRAYVDAGYDATKRMRTVEFLFMDRLVLTPMEIIPSLKAFMIYALSALLFFGLQPSGVVFHEAWTNGRPFLLLGLAAVFAGGFFTPVFLNLIPFRSFAVKGWIAGMIALAATAPYWGGAEMGTPLKAFAFLFFPLASSYIALQFTGASVFTGISGVKKELKYAIPAYALGAFVSLILLAVFKLGQLGVL